MNDDALRTAHGPRRAAWPAGGPERAIAAGRRRLRRRRLAAGGGALASAAVLGTALTVTAARDERSLSPVAPASAPARPPRDGRAWIGPAPAGTELVPSHDPSACTPGNTDDGFCSFAEAPATVVPGSVATLGFRVCRAGGAEPAPVGLTAPERLSMMVTEVTAAGEGLMWRWPYDADPAPFARTFAPGDCLTWRVRWAGQADDGYALPAGPAVVVAQLSREPGRGDVAPAPAQADVVVAPARP